MTLEEFRASLARDTPPDASTALIALWHDARGDWDRAHEVAQAIDDATGAWIHAYLHRKEGDLGNARYWYDRARKTVETGPLEGEWERIVRALCSGTAL
jgi:hypothetical protein